MNRYLSYTAEMKMNLVTEYLKSEKTMRKFSREKNVNFHTFYTQVRNHPGINHMKNY